MRRRIWARAILGSLAMLACATKAMSLDAPMRFGNIDAKLTVTKTSMYTSQVQLNFIGREEDYKNCASLSVYHRDGKTGMADTITCRADNDILTITIENNEAVALRSKLTAGGIEYRGGVLSFINPI